MFGKPVIRGTRVTVELILRKIAAGMSEQQIIEHHPHLALEDIRAAGAFAANHLASEADDLLSRPIAFNEPSVDERGRSVVRAVGADGEGQSF